MVRKHTRRAFLASSLAGLGGISGCLRLQSGSGQSGGSQTTVTSTPTETETTSTETTNTTPENAPDRVTEDWPQLMFDAGNTGYAPNRDGPTEGVETVWTFESVMNFDASLSIADGTAYGAAWGDVLYALNVQTGEEEWRQPLESSVSIGAPAIEDGTIVFGTHDGRVYGLNSDGGYRWEFTTDSPIFSSQKIDGGSVYATSSNGDIFSLSLSTGDKQWEASVEEDYTIASPAVGNDTVVVAGSDFGTSIPEDEWILSREFTEWVHQNGGDGTLYGFSTDSGEQLWSVPLESASIGSPAVSDGMAYIGNYAGQLKAIDMETSSVSWEKQTDGAITAAPAVTDSYVYGPSWDGTLYAWERGGGRRKWILPTQGSITRSPIAVGDTVYLNGSDGHVYAADADSGRMQWQYRLDVGSDSTPAMVNGMLVIGTKGRDNDDPNKPSPGTIYALG